MSDPSSMVGVILAAGKGSRMYPFSDTLPKSLFPILNRPLLAHQLLTMKQADLDRVIIVVGYYGFEIVRAIGDGREFGLQIEYVDQEETLGIAHAVGLLESRIHQPFLLFLGDIFFAAQDITAMIRPLLEGRAHAVLAAKREENPEVVRRNFAILQAPDGSVCRVIEKPRHTRSNLKGCGLYAFDLSIFDAVRRTPRTAGRDEYEITDSIQLLIQDGYRIEVMEGIEFDINLTCPEDILAANQKELSRQGISRFIGKNFSGPPQERIRRSVIGDNVSLPPGITVEDSVIFSNVELRESRDIKRMIITPDQRLALDPTISDPLG